MNELFKRQISYKIIYNLLYDICIQEKNYLIFNLIQFKKLKFYSKLDNILFYLKPFYKETKHKYIENGCKYKGFVTILRQLCKLHNIKYMNKITYDHSNYTITYYFYI